MNFRTFFYFRTFFKTTRAREKRRKSKRTNNANYERLVPSSIQARVISKTVPLCGAAQHTGVWGVPRPNEKIDIRERCKGYTDQVLFAPWFSWFLGFDSITVQRSALCRSRRELSNEYLLAKFGFDTAENEPYENHT